MNNRMVKRATKALHEYAECDCDKEANVTDLLTDLRHYCDEHGIDYAEQDKRAYAHYVAEKNGEQ